MSVRSRKGKKVKEVEDINNPLKEETSIDNKLIQDILTDLRKNLKTKVALLHKEEVDCFIGQHAVNHLMDSKWATGDDDVAVLFKDRTDAIGFCQQLLLQRNFVRCTKTKKKKWTPFKITDSLSKNDKDNDATKDTKGDEDNATKDANDASASKDEDQNTETKDDMPPDDEQNENTKEADKKKKKKIKLREHKEQEFLDSNDLYAWTFQVTSPYNYLIGIAMMGVFMLYNLLPIMPPVVGYYLSQLSTVLLFIVLGIICLAIGRYALFILVWILTLGKYHFWLLPQLFADCSFLESFTPLFSLQEYKPSSKTKKKHERKKSSSKKAIRTEIDDDESEETKCQADIFDSKNHPDNDEIPENSQNDAGDVEDDWEKLEIPVENSDDTNADDVTVS